MDKRDDHELLKAKLHRKILDRLDLVKLGKTSNDSARDEVLVLIRSAVNAEVVPLSFAERECLSREILHEVFPRPALGAVLRKGSWLTTREFEIVSAVVANYSKREIAEYFKISEDTLKQHLNGIFEQLGVATSRLIALRASWLDRPEDGDALGIAVKKPRSPNLNSGSAAASPDELG